MSGNMFGPYRLLVAAAEPAPWLRDQCGHRAVGGIAVIDTAAEAVIEPLTVSGVDLNGTLVATPDGQHLLVTALGNQLAVVDAQTGHLVDTIDVGLQPIALAVTADGRITYVLDNNGDRISVIDTAARAVFRTIDIGADTGATSLALAPDGRFAYVGNPETTTVVDLTTGTVVTTLPAGGARLAVAPGGTRVFTTNETGLSVIDPISRTVLDTIPIYSAFDVAVLPDGSRGYVSTAFDVFVVAIDR